MILYLFYEDQTITVTYAEGGITVYAYYDVHIESADSIYQCEFMMYGDPIVLELNLCDDGTGAYSFTRGTNSSTREFTL